MYLWTSPPQRAVWAKEIHGLKWLLPNFTKRTVRGKRNVLDLRKLGVSPAQLICWYLKEVWKEPSWDGCLAHSKSMSFYMTSMLQSCHWRPVGAKRKTVADLMHITFSGGFYAFPKTSEIGYRWRQHVRRLLCCSWHYYGFSVSNWYVCSCTEH